MLHLLAAIMFMVTVSRLYQFRSATQEHADNGHDTVRRCRSATSAAMEQNLRNGSFVFV